jgi:hypothetical protein
MREAEVLMHGIPAGILEELNSFERAFYLIP